MLCVCLGAFAATATIDGVEVSVFASPIACRSAHVFNGSACRAESECERAYFGGGAHVSVSQTEAPVSAVPGRVLGSNSIELVVRHPAVLDRVMTGIVLHVNRSACNYPGVNWRKGVVLVAPASSQAMAATPTVCHDVYISSIPWTEDCGLQREENATHVVFSGNATAAYDDALGSLDGVPLGLRKVSSVIRFVIVQPKVVRDISTHVQVLDEPRLLGAVTRQTFDYKTGNATLTVALSLAAPLRTVGVGAAVPPAGIALAASGGVDDSLCANESVTACQQRYTFSIDPQERCDLDGNYDFDFAVACQARVRGGPDCPVSETMKPLRIRVTLDSDDICEVVQGLFAAEGSISPHGAFDAANFSFGPLRRAFLQSDAMHFLVEVRSLNAFALESSEVILIETLNATGARVTIFDAARANATAAAWALVRTSAPGNALRNATSHRHRISFVADPRVFGDVARGVPVDSVVVVAVRVAFANPVGPKATRRRSLAEPVNSRSVSTSIDFQIQSETAVVALVHVPVESPSTATTTYAIVGAVVGTVLCVAAIVGAVLWQRRRGAAHGGTTLIVALPETAAWTSPTAVQRPPPAVFNPVRLTRVPSYLIDSGRFVAGVVRRASDALAAFLR